MKKIEVYGFVNFQKALYINRNARLRAFCNLNALRAEQGIIIPSGIRVAAQARPVASRTQKVKGERERKSERDSDKIRGGRRKK